MDKIDIIKSQLPNIGIEGECTISLLNPGRKRKEIYLIETQSQKRVVKFFKRNLLELFQKEINFRKGNPLQYAPQLLYYNIKLDQTLSNQKIQGDDFMFFVEEFIQGKTLNELLDESDNLNHDFNYINQALQTYMKVFSSTYHNNFILNNANPNNIIFKENNIKNPFIIDRTSMKDITGHPKKGLEKKYNEMLDKNISNIILKHIK